MFLVLTSRDTGNITRINLEHYSFSIADELGSKVNKGDRVSFKSKPFVESERKSVLDLCKKSSLRNTMKLYVQDMQVGDTKGTIVGAKWFPQFRSLLSKYAVLNNKEFKTKAIGRDDPTTSELLVKRIK